MSRQSNQDNRANQLNPNNDAYWTSRGLDERPEDWEERTSTDNPRQESNRSVSGKSERKK